MMSGIDPPPSNNANAVFNINSCNIDKSVSYESGVILLNNSGGNGSFTINGGMIDANNSSIDLTVKNNNYAIGLMKGRKSSDYNVTLYDACNGENTVSQTNKELRIAGYNYEGHYVDMYHTISDVIQHCYNVDDSDTCDGCQPACFTGNTLIKTIDFYKEIQNIKVNDKIYSMNIDTGEIEIDEVDEVLIHFMPKTLIYKLYFNENIYIEVTPEHRFMVENLNNWLAIQDMERIHENMFLNNQLNKYKPLVVEYSIQNSIKVYNLKIKKNHNYLVSNLNLVVHNDKGY